MTIKYDDQTDYYAQVRIPGDDDIFVPRSSMPTASMVSSPSSYSSFDPLARHSSFTTNNRMGAADDTSVMCLPSPTSSPPNYNTSTYEFAAATTPSDQSLSNNNFAYTTDRPSSLPLVASTTPTTTYGYDGTMATSNGRNVSTSSYTIPAPEDSVMAALPGESDIDKKMRRRRRRRARMACGSFAGVVVGGVILGPLGAVVGGVSAGAITRKISKKREMRKDQRVADQYTSAVPIPVQRGEAV
jgi:hypothetical protein